MSKYLITGVAGFVGRYFVEYLRKIEPDALICGVGIEPAVDMDIVYYSLDMSDGAAVRKVVADFRPDYVLHLASVSSVGQSWENPAFCFMNNTGIMLNLLDAVRFENVSCRILSIGSSEEYGVKDGCVLTEDMPLNPQNPYAVAKVSQEYLAKVYVSLGLDVVMARSFNHIGSRQSERFVVPSFVKQLVEMSQGKRDKMLVGNIEVQRDFTDVRDVVAAYYKLLHQGKKGEVYNVCSGRVYPLKEIISTAEGLLGIKANIEVDKSKLRPNDVLRIEGNNDKLRALGWQPKYGLKQTIENMVEFMKGLVK